jgi:hypothetical protein
VALNKGARSIGSVSPPPPPRLEPAAAAPSASSRASLARRHASNPRKFLRIANAARAVARTTHALVTTTIYFK